MINLLGNDIKKELHAARLNVMLRRYLLFFMGVAVAIAAALGVGYWILKNDQARLEQSSASFTAEKAKYTTAIKDGKEFTANLAIAKAILSNEILFTDFAINIAKILPKDSSLQNLTISTEDLQKPIILTIQTTSYDNAVNVKDAFEASSIFENVNIVSTSAISDPKTKYSHTVNLNVSISKDAFIKQVSR